MVNIFEEVHVLLTSCLSHTCINFEEEKELVNVKKSKKSLDVIEIGIAMANPTIQEVAKFAVDMKRNL